MKAASSPCSPTLNSDNPVLPGKLASSIRDPRWIELAGRAVFSNLLQNMFRRRGTEDAGD